MATVVTALELIAPATANVVCPLCGGAGSPLFEVAPYVIQECQSCRHQFLPVDDVEGHIARTYADDYFSGSCTGYHDYLSEERLLTARGRTYARKLSRFCTPGTVLDIGAAAGFTLRGFRDAGWKPFGIDANRTMARYADERLGIRVEATSLESWDTSQCFDLATMLQVLPHFIDPQQALNKVARVVRHGGLLLIETWNRDSWTARLFGLHWHERNPPSVLHWFSVAGLAQLARQAGFDLVAQGSLLRWINAAHAKAILRHQAAGSAVYRALSSIGNLIPDRVSIPYLADDLFWMLCRKS